MSPVYGVLGRVVVAVGDGRRVAHSSHGDRLGYRRSETGREQDGSVASSGRDPKNDPEDVDQPVLAAQDDVAKHVFAGVVAMAPANGQQ